eukprot:8518530-Pyramimonas_sp.AAC.1
MSPGCNNLTVLSSAMSGEKWTHDSRTVHSRVFPLLAAWIRSNRHLPAARRFVVFNTDRVDVAKGNEYIASCRNFDGGFGATPGDESHAGQIFTAVGALAIGGGLHH